MTAPEFRARLRQHFEANADVVLLRVALSGDLDHPVELTGRDLLERASIPSFRASYNINFYLVTAMLFAIALVEPRLASAFERLETRLLRLSMGVAWSRFLLRPILYAAGLLLFMVFDDLDRQFIYFQF